ncbi:hypothetical protein EV426DRAFT_703580 [Tirmania nivea]|nr:hypothetical protein EV426DRAFT_703580 [Tirmania nivea]
MSSPASCHSPASQSSYCNSIFSYNGSGSSHTLDDMTNITTSDSATPKEAFSPLMFASPSPSLSSASPADGIPGLAPLSPPLNFLYTTAGSLGSSPSSSHSSLSQYPQEYYRPQEPPTLPQLHTHSYPSRYVSNQQQYSYAPQTTPTSYYASESPYARTRRSLPPIDPTRFEEEEWYTPSGKKVRHSAMHLHCATINTANTNINDGNKFTIIILPSSKDLAKPSTTFSMLSEPSNPGQQLIHAVPAFQPPSLVLLPASTGSIIG